jgi:four helix bundle protein
MPSSLPHALALRAESIGTAAALPTTVGVRSFRELIAWQLADEFKREIFRILAASARATQDWRFHDQLRSASWSIGQNIIEGFLRHSAGDFSRFLGFSLGSLGEAEGWLANGVELGYFGDADCEAARRLGRRAAVAITRLKQSQRRLQAQDRASRHRARRTRRT